MANKAHLKVLKQGVKAWNRWRVNHPRVKPDLSGADLECRHLDGANFALANLNGANLGNADLDAANLFGAKMRRAYLSTAILSQADLTAADLANADLSSSTLYQAKLDDANLREANLDNIQMESTQLGANDLRTVKGLETVAHTGPSLIGIDTIYLSKGDIPEVFLRGAGVPESFIANMKALVAAMEPIQFYSCFISYSSKDDDFAKRLYFDLQREGVRCWFAPEDLKIGAETRTGIDEAIRVHDKLLIVLSANSVRSAWVKKEVETAFEKEQKQNRMVLFPIRLDDAVMETDKAWGADIRRMRNIGDFSKWKNRDEYQKAFGRLMRDLKAEEKGQA